ncbi:hypothetical protein J6590_037246 [Homalodisca vitripennis]|nr:hypothetical protein J6590_037246 [Homalodisca vitripennis]
MDESLKSKQLVTDIVSLANATQRYLLGILTERSKRNASADLNVPRNFPGLPLYGSVSAATPVISNSNPVTVQEISPSSKSRVGQIMKYGFPSLDNVRSLDDYVLAYDKRNRVANWVFEHLTYERVKHNDAVDRSKCQFTEDTSIHDYFRSKNTDYKGSGFDRGHLAAAGNHRVCQKDVDQTFLLSNMAPQVGVGFNRDSWNRLEKHRRHSAARTFFVKELVPTVKDSNSNLKIDIWFTSDPIVQRLLNK